jgi:putative DNA primase/helicase
MPESRKSMPPNEEGRPGAGVSAEAFQEPHGTESNRSAGDCTVLRVPVVTADMDAVGAAMAYAGAGWYVLPVKRGTKDPGSVVGKGWQHKSSRDPQQIVAWLAGTDYGLALHCGRSGAVVFDVDQATKVPEILATYLESAPYQSSRPDEFGRGHYVFGMPPGRTLGNGTGSLGGEWGEVRGLNGVIVVAPSEHAEEGHYRWVRAGLVPPLPEEIAEQLDDASPARDAATDEQVTAFLAEYTEATRPEILHGWRKALEHHFETGSRHEGAVSVTTGALKEARAGFFSAQAVMDILQPMFVAAATRPPTGGERQRTQRQAEDEYKGVLAWSVAQANAADLAAVRRRTEAKMPPADADGGADSGDIRHSAHLGMAIKLSTQFKSELRFVNGIGWYRWDGKRWARDGNGGARRAVHEVIKRDRAIVEKLELPEEEEQMRLKQIARYETASAINGILTEAAALQTFSIEVGDLDADPYLLNCANGTLDLRTMELRDHDPTDLITKLTRAAHISCAIDTTWSAFLQKVLPDNNICDYLRRVIGLALLGIVIEHNLVILTGPGRNGKGTFYKAVNFALDDYAGMTDPELFMERRGAHPTGDMTLLGLRLAVVSESGRGRALDEARMKRFTGGDTISARYLYKDQVSFEPSHLALFITNHLPKVSGDDEAVWARLRVVPFNVVIPIADQDKHLEEKLQAEADAILAWAVAGWQDYRERGEQLDEPAGVLVATRNVGRFIADDNWCLKANTLKATTAELHDGYQRWAHQEGGDDIGLKGFALALDSRGFPVTQRTGKARWREGIALHPAATDCDA